MYFSEFAHPPGKVAVIRPATPSTPAADCCATSCSPAESNVNATLIRAGPQDLAKVRVVPLRDRCGFGRFRWLISLTLSVTYVAV